MARLSAIVSLAAIVLNASAASAQSPLGSAQGFAVLGASTVTNTGATVITGDVGVSPGTAITGFLLPPANVIEGPGTVTPGLGLVHGTIRPGGLVAAKAHGDAGVAYAALNAMACPSIPGGNNLSGQILGTSVPSLPSGVYCFNTEAQLTGTLSLTGGGPWVFKIGTTLTTASNSSVVAAGQNCSGSNVFWLVGTSATLGTGTKFAGNILALASITVTTGVSVSGSVMALTGAVTLDTNNISVCRSGSGGLPPVLDKCEDHHDKDGDDHDKDGDHHDKDGDHHDKDGDHHDKDKDHKDKDNDRDHKDNDGKDKKRG